MVIHQRSGHTRTGGDVFDKDIFIWHFREHRGCGVEQLFTPPLGL
jgi:hypothetical protein